MRLLSVNLGLILMMLVILCDARPGRENGKEKENGQKNGNENGGSSRSKGGNGDRKGGTKVFKVHPMGRTPPGDLRRVMASERVRVAGGSRRLQFFSERSIRRLQQALHELNQCRRAPKASNVTVDETPFILEGDILPTLDGIKEELATCKNETAKRIRRQVLRDQQYLWPTDRTIKILLSDHAKYSAPNVAQYFANLIDELHRRTCLRLELVDERPKEPYLVVITQMDNVPEPAAICSSYIGRVVPYFVPSDIPEAYRDEHAQPLNLVNRGCWSYDTVAHETLHALGFYHEQSRPDRDAYVDIDFDNIKDDKENNFQVCSTKSLPCVPWSEYSPSSIMHYGRVITDCGFAEDCSKPYISPKPHLPWGNLMGIGKDLNQPDYYRLNQLYCRARCAPTLCPRAETAYPNPHNCSQCFCTTGIGEGNYFLCGGHLESTDDWQTLTIENRKHDPKPNQCRWLIKAPYGGQVELNASDILLPSSAHASPVEPCLFASIEVRTDALFRPTNAYCAAEAQRTFESAGDKLMIFHRWVYSGTWPDSKVYFRTKPGSAEGQPPTTTTTQAAGETTTTTTKATTTAATTTDTTPTTTTTKDVADELYHRSLCAQLVGPDQYGCMAPVGQYLFCIPPAGVCDGQPHCGVPEKLDEDPSNCYIRDEWLNEQSVIVNQK